MELPDRFIHQATRYCLGRMTCAVGEHCRWLVENWERIPANEQAIIMQSVEQEFRHDVDSREAGHEYHPLGMDMDRAEWEQVRKLWKEN